MMILIFSLFFSISSHAHPVIYQDGFMLGSMTMHEISSYQANYSFTHKWAVGAEYWRLKDDNWQLLKLNHLLWRKNSEDSQANVYLVSGLGRQEDSYQQDSLGRTLGVETDWESRRYFTSFKYLYLAGNDTDVSVWSARVGLSPMLAGYHELQTWVMLQAWTDPLVAKETMITPLLRFFYRNLLWEAGASTKGDFMFNFMVHL